MKNQFSIGEMAKLHNTTVKTLRYYDEIDLLKPIFIDRESGYRYYATEQFEQLNTIQYLKKIGFSLKEIKQHLDFRNIDDFLLSLKKQREITTRTIAELERINQRFENRIMDIQFAQQIKDLGVPLVREMHEREIVRLMDTISTDVELEISLRKLENVSNMHSSIFIGGVGLTVSEQKVKAREFTEYNSIFILIEDETIQSKLQSSLPAGQYATIYFCGDHTESRLYYEILLDYIEKENLTVTGDSIERTIIDQYMSKTKEDHLTEIQIPVSY